MSWLARRWLFRGALWILFGYLVAAAVWFAALEMRSSSLQARVFTKISEDLGYRLKTGPSETIRFPENGPYDRRLGYVGLPDRIARLKDRGFGITAQANFSPKLAQWVDHGFYAVYDETDQAGLKIVDRRGRPLYKVIYPGQVYSDFDSIPPLILNTLLFIENRELLDAEYATRNPAVEWDRLAKGVLDLVKRNLGSDIHVAGGSTLATQLVKYRHSPSGITPSVAEKVRQMATASLKAYVNGPDTLTARRKVALSYLNSVPLAAAPGYGEVHGIADGLRIWFGADFENVNRLLHPDALTRSEPVSREQGRAYRQVLSLLLAQRRPTYLLNDGHAKLQELTDSHLRLLANAGIISSSMRDRALTAEIHIARLWERPDALPFLEHKTQTVIRTRLASTLGVPSLYDLDRMNLSARTTLDLHTQHAIAKALRSLKEPDKARAAGVTGYHLLRKGDDLENVVYSFALYERTPSGNLLRVQTDNYDQPLDINEGIRLDLGSTAKLRTTVHYLQIVDELYQRYSGTERAALAALKFHHRDHLSRWVVDQLRRDAEMTLPEILEKALERRYSASAGERFFTGGGLHSFSNFSKWDNRRVLSVRTALRDSVNLVFIRVMRDIVYHYLYRPGGIAAKLEAGGEELRREYLRRFADQEGKVFLKRFYNQYKDTPPGEFLDRLRQHVYPLPHRLATVYRSVSPDEGPEAFARFLRAHATGKKLADDDIEYLYNKYSVERFNLQDRGYITRIHPLELWLVGFLMKAPNATLQEAIEASVEQRQEAYRWLFKTRRKHRQDRRIRTLLEKEVFVQIGDAWRRLGYPFRRLTPSYATAIGASADRPAALAVLMGILVNDGVRYPTVRFDTVRFAANTPFETVMEAQPTAGKRVLSAEVAQAVRDALIGVVEDGTAQRLREAYTDAEGNVLTLGGKTGTGDHVRKKYAANGRVIASEVISRTATFVFFLGDSHFGTLTAYVDGPEAARYRFTSSLPVQVLKSLAPVIEPLIVQRAGEEETSEGKMLALAPSHGKRQ